MTTLLLLIYAFVYTTGIVWQCSKLLISAVKHSLVIALFLLFIDIAILTQPKNTICNPGDKVEFTIKTSPTAQRHQWYLNGQEISNEDKDYEGSTTEHLLIVKCLPKHKGSYNCVVSFESDAPLTSKSATLKIGIKKINLVIILLKGTVAWYKR